MTRVTTPELAPVAVLARRARAKFATVPMATRLAEVARQERHRIERESADLAGRLGLLESSYRNSVYCCGSLYHRAATAETPARLSSRWCGNRWCLPCMRVRAARAWARYGPTLREWPRRYMVTLTLPNVGGAQLHGTLRQMLRDFAACKRGMARAHTRVAWLSLDRVKLVGLRKIECTWRASHDDYHPHFHVIVDSREAAHALVARWIELNPRAVRRAQDVRRADDGALAELFKYFTKLTAGGKEKSPVPASRLDVIFRAMRGLRVYQPVGFTAAPGPDEEGTINDATPPPLHSFPGESWDWDFEQGDWTNTTGGVLSGYTPSDRFRAFAEALGAERQPDE